MNPEEEEEEEEKQKRFRECVCINCGYVTACQKRRSCSERKCPECGTSLMED